MAYDAVRRSVLLFSGDTETGYDLGFGQQPKTGDTWTWNGTEWTRLQPATSPPVRWGAGIAYDAAHSTVLLYGGPDAGSLRDTWSWDGSTWTDVTPR